MSTAQAIQEKSYFAHPDARIETEEIGPRTRVWAFAHVLAGARIGADCNLCDHTFIEGGAAIGDRVTIKCGVQLWEGVTLEDDVFVGPNATFANDPLPRSRRRPASYARTRVRRGASIGANATILPGVTIGAEAMIGAGAVVTKDVPPRAIVIGNPGYVNGYMDCPSPPVEARAVNAASPSALAGGAALYQLPRITDHRGNLSFAELNQALPFAVARYFLVFGVPNREIRGEHAHRTLHQYLVAVHGSCSVRLFDGEGSAEVRLDRPDCALHVPPMVWTTQYRYSPDAVLLVLASDVYRDEDYIRNFEDYQASVAHGSLAG